MRCVWPGVASVGMTCKMGHVFLKRPNIGNIKANEWLGIAATKYCKKLQDSMPQTFAYDDENDVGRGLALGNKNN